MACSRCCCDGPVVCPCPPANLVDSGEFQRIPGIETTNSIVPVPFWSVPFTLSAPGDVLFQMAAIVFEAPPVADPANFMGFTFQADIDGNPLPDNAAFEFNANGASVNTSVETAVLQTYAPGLAAGAHTLNIQWSANDVDNLILCGQANIAIQSL
jgi:hypothetical protein